MKRSIIITDLTRFKPGNPDVCLAGIDRATGECLRPIPYLKFTECTRLKILPGGILTGEFTPSPNLTSPHMEDCRYENLTFDGACPGTEFEQVLAATCASSVEAGFEVSIPAGDKVIPHDFLVPRSIITVRAAPRDVEIVEDRYKPGSIKLHFTDSSGCRHRFLPITDLGFFDYAQRHHQSSALAALNADIARQNEVFLRIGLSRRFMNSQGKDGFWMQANGIYTFPMVLRYVRSYPESESYHE